MLKRLSPIFIVILIFVFISSSNAQVNRNSITNAVSTLKQKVLLTNEQESAVLGILVELKENVSADKSIKDTLIKEAQSKIESYLDKKQKIKYEIIKSDWWKQVSELL